MADDNSKPFNPRKFKVWDTATLNTAMYHAAEIKHKLEKASRDSELNIEDMKPTLISSDLLYLLVQAYLAAYESLTEENLLHTGSPRKTKPILH